LHSYDYMHTYACTDTHTFLFTPTLWQQCKQGAYIPWTRHLRGLQAGQNLLCQTAGHWRRHWRRLPLCRPEGTGEVAAEDDSCGSPSGSATAKGEAHPLLPAAKAARLKQTMVTAGDAALGDVGDPSVYGDGWACHGRCFAAGSLIDVSVTG